MDSSYSADLIASNKLESIYSSIVRIYKQKSEYNAKKAAMLSDKLISLLNVPLIELINMNFANASTTESMNKQEFIFKCNNIFHRFLTLFDLINSAEYRLKGLCNRLASIALSNLIQAANMEKFEPTRQEDDVSLFKKKKKWINHSASSLKVGWNARLGSESLQSNFQRFKLHNVCSNWLFERCFGWISVWHRQWSRYERHNFGEENCSSNRNNFILKSFL